MSTTCTSSQPCASTTSPYLQDLHSGSQSRASSRPSTSSSYSSSVAYPLSATSAHSCSAFQPSPDSPYPSPTSSALKRMRPLPRPPASASSSRSKGPPRPLPKPPLRRAQSHDGFQSPAPNPLAVRHVPSGIPTPPPEARIPPPLQSAPPERPSIRLDIGGIPSIAPVSCSQDVTSPLSPIAFNLPGPRTLRKRREEELARHMTALGFVEAPSPTGECPEKNLNASNPGQDASSTFTESDEERDVVLLVDHDSDSDDHHPSQIPPRNASRAAMLSLFSDHSPDVDGKKKPSFPHEPRYGGQKSQNQNRDPWKDAGRDEDEREYGGRTSSHIEVRVDVEVEAVTKEAVARTKRRFSRKWVRERKGKRWTERDFGEVLSQLRKLR